MEVDAVLKYTRRIGGHRWIHEDLLKRLAEADIVTSAINLELVLNDAGEAEVLFCGSTYRVSRKGVRRADGQKFTSATASALIHYVLQGSRSRPAGQFIPFSELAGPLFKEGSYVKGAFEHPITKRFEGRVPELLAAAGTGGGRQGGEAGLGSISLIFNLLPHIPLQLIFYDRDEEFPARSLILLDRNATQMVEFEVLAVLVTLFVQFLTKP